MKAFVGILAAGLVGTTIWAQEAKIAEGESAGIPSKVEKQQAAKSETKVAPSIEKIDEKSLVGKPVYDEKGRELGRVQELVMDKQNGQPGYAVIEVKDEEGLKLPVPIRALKQGADNEKLVLNVSESVLTALELYRDEELPAPDAFSVENQEAVGGAATSESGTSSSADQEKTEQIEQPEQK